MAATTRKSDPPLLRFDRGERLLHWSNAVLFLTLLLTGASLYVPQLSEIVKRRHLVKEIHVYAGVLLPVPLVLTLLSGRWGRAFRADVRRLNRWSADDRRWLRTRGRDRKVRIGKFNAGQKLNAAFVAGAIPVMLATGLIMRFPSHFSLSWRTGATFVHDWVFLGLAVAITGHILFAVNDPLALRAMVRGRIPRSWARTHAPRWLEEESAEAGADPRPRAGADGLSPAPAPGAADAGAADAGAADAGAADAPGRGRPDRRRARRTLVAVESERARRWVGTMDGHAAGSGVRTAHADSVAAVQTARPWKREEREELELQRLAPGATHAVGAGHRPKAEEPDAERTCFERDRDRITHAAAFRRLAGKTQVFIFPDDHQRTRLTHALEVAQVATSIARSLRLNVALTEAIAMGHDCGHGPAGHASEDAFSPYVPGGFDHAVWGADVVLTGLNLCVETTDGVRNHSWSRPAPATPEGEVVSWADRIAYVCHDFEDAVSAGIVAADALPPLVRERCGAARGAQLRAFIDAVVDASVASGRIGMTPDLADALAAFRTCNYERIYLRPASVEQAAAVQRLLGALVEHLAATPELLPAPSLEAAGWPSARSDAAVRAAVTYVAGMTDRYALARAEQWLGWDAGDLVISAT